MKRHLVFDQFRPVIESIADLVCCHGYSTDDDGLIRSSLIEKGFDLTYIRAAEEWCDAVQRSGSLIDALSFFVTTSTGSRVSSPLERVSVSDEVWSVIENCRARGILTADMAERLLEGARAMDTRDWDDDDVRAFFLDACVANTLPSQESKMEQALLGDFKNYYS